MELVPAARSGPGARSPLPRPAAGPGAHVRATRTSPPRPSRNAPAPPPCGGKCVWAHRPAAAPRWGTPGSPGEPVGDRARGIRAKVQEIVAAHGVQDRLHQGRGGPGHPMGPGVAVRGQSRGTRTAPCDRCSGTTKRRSRRTPFRSSPGGGRVPLRCGRMAPWPPAARPGPRCRCGGRCRAARRASSPGRGRQPGIRPRRPGAGQCAPAWRRVHALRVPAPYPTTAVSSPSMPKRGRRSSNGARGSTVVKEYAVLLIQFRTGACRCAGSVMRTLS